MLPLSEFLTLELTTQVIGQEPLISTVILLLIVLVIPIIFERLKLPALVGMIGAGVVIGPYGWNLFDSGTTIITLFSEIGLAYLMFVTGLELNIQSLRRQQKRSLLFGNLIFCLPLILGIFAGKILGFNWYSAILIGCLLPSYSPLAYPIINRLGLVNNQAVNMAIGSKVVPNMGTLVILTLSLASFQSGVFSLGNIISKLGIIIIYCVIVVVGFDWVIKEFLSRFGDDEVNQFSCVLMSVFLAVVIAQFMGLTKVLGFFLAGLAVNESLGESPVKEKLVFVGSLLFIPVFFIDIGLRIDLSVLFTGYDTIRFLLILLAILLVSKFLAVVCIKVFYRYSWQETLTIWSLSIPIVGTTLAVALGGYQTGLVSVEILNCAIILVLITATVGPLLTNLIASETVTVTFTKVNYVPKITSSKQPKESVQKGFIIIVPLFDLDHQKYLIEMAALLAHHSQGKVLPLAIAPATSQMNTPQLRAACQHSEWLLAQATAQTKIQGASVEPLLRIDDNFAQGICRAAREKRVNLIIMDWGKRKGLRAQLFGNIIDHVIWAAHCPVAIANLVESPNRIQRILIPIENLVTPSLTPLHFAQTFANSNESQITVMNVCDRRTSADEIVARRSYLSEIICQLAVPNPPDIQIITHENPSQAILQAARLYDLVILPFQRHLTTPGGLAINDVAQELFRQLTCSMIILGEPQHDFDTPQAQAEGILGSRTRH
ncbi:MAG: sodium:proton antiporter [Nostocales cyanobacterium]|nr:MAG: sodium:proton antiporter [Nostocales cyanobacterium]TAF12330.1 MAG: sodium:proton antiporter [Nostocales cyanobacterium]